MCVNCPAWKHAGIFYAIFCRPEGRLFCTLTTREVVRMTDKQARFCEEYMIDLNATQAAIRAGYSPKTANEQAARLLANVSIQNRIAQLQAEQSRRTGVSADRVVRELAKVAFVNAGDLIDARTASLKSDAAPDDLAAVQSVKVKTFGEDGLEQEVKLADKLKALDLLGRHLGMFNGVSGDASDQLAEARKILGGVDSVID
nr:MAG TPA: Terminase small subunit [Caudoviricetes sp.]